MSAARVDAAVERLCELEATKLRPYEESRECWVAIQDLEGNKGHLCSIADVLRNELLYFLPVIRLFI